ncbi:hypothetical protein A8709_22980 [Paenibacillus pectinilyticus]|uniref:O-antigen polymerase n=1 Tax=Paenibacillus pectinilyticus TaxID=512399 RepID=A0A1C0ZRM1_9BACL|nr:hypothetical protein [Paenibacillus pectinilyticus]OCT10704.1 hypothetical protein A8709_22980 [Paenibacillus pectinilyticus]
MERIKVYLLFISLMCLRPAAFGGDFTILGISCCLLCLYIYFLQNSLKRVFQFRKNYLLIIVLVCTYWVYIMLQATLTSSPIASSDILKGAITGVITIISFAIMISDEGIRYKLFRLFIQMMIFLCASYIVTLTISILTPIEKLKIFSFITDDVNYRSVYFPFTPIYGVMTVQGHVFQRFLGIFRESGISQAFMIWAIMSLNKYGLGFKRNTILLLGGIIGTLSTAGIAVYMGTIAVRMILNKRYIIPIIVFPFVYYLIMYAPYIGISNKMVTHSTSITDRTGAMSFSMRMFTQHVFGIGVGNSPIETNGGINLIASLHMIGIIGLVIVLLIYTLPIVIASDKKSYILGILPLFITALFSEPIYDSPIMFIMILVCLHESRKAPFYLET